LEQYKCPYHHQLGAAQSLSPPLFFLEQYKCPYHHQLGAAQRRHLQTKAMAPRSREKPAVARNSWSWNSRENFDPAAFKSVDGDKIFYENRWQQRQMLHWGVAALLKRSQRALIEDIRNKRVISLEGEFNKECQQGVTQVPYRKFSIWSICLKMIDLNSLIHIAAISIHQTKI
jgi:hypothetical protein